jgi:hypothetical protein
MSVMCELDVCYEVPDGLGFVFPSLLPPLAQGQRKSLTWPSGPPQTPAECSLVAALWCPTAASCRPLFRCCCTGACTRWLTGSYCVRRDHFFLTLFDCNVMVRFNTAAVEIRSSSGRTACSIDIAVSAHVESVEIVLALHLTALSLSWRLSAHGRTARVDHCS